MGVASVNNMEELLPWRRRWADVLQDILSTNDSKNEVEKRNNSKTSPEDYDPTVEDIEKALKFEATDDDFMSKLVPIPRAEWNNPPGSGSSTKKKRSRPNRRNNSVVKKKKNSNSSG